MLSGSAVLYTRKSHREIDERDRVGLDGFICVSDGPLFAWEGAGAGTKVWARFYAYFATREKSKQISRLPRPQPSVDYYSTYVVRI